MDVSIVGQPITPAIRYHLEVKFCPYCGAATVDSTAKRTYCTTCGDDIASPARIEELESDLSAAQERCEEWEKECDELGKLLEAEETRAARLCGEIDDLKNALQRAQQPPVPED